MKRIGWALLALPVGALFGLVVWYFMLNGGVVGLRSDPKLFAIGGAVIAFAMSLMRNED